MKGKQEHNLFDTRVVDYNSILDNQGDMPVL